MPANDDFDLAKTNKKFSEQKNHFDNFIKYWQKIAINLPI